MTYTKQEVASLITQASACTGTVSVQGDDLGSDGTRYSVICTPATAQPEVQAD